MEFFFIKWFEKITDVYDMYVGEYHITYQYITIMYVMCTFMHVEKQVMCVWSLVYDDHIL